jgi:cytochrome c biogenesis protein ResB
MLAAFAGLRVFLALLAAIVAACLAGILLDSTGHGRELVYGSVWFNGLLGVLALNLIVCALRRRGFARGRRGMLLTHAGVAVALVGAAANGLTAREGLLLLAPGEGSGIALADPRGEPHALRLPFSVHLDDAGIRTAGGRPTAYRSRVAVVEGGRVVATHVIEVNRPLRHAGWRVHQSGMRAAGDGTVLSVLKVRRAPALPLVWAGAGLLCVGLAAASVRAFLREAGPPPSETASP